VRRVSERAVFLDRDGVVNENVVRDGRPYPPASLEQLVVGEQTSAALHALKTHGFRLLIVTNQPDVGRGTQTRAIVESLHEALSACLPLDSFYTCYHAHDGECECRKPRPGLILTAAAEHDLDLRRCFMIGDRWRDVEAGANAGVRVAFIDRGLDERRPAHPPDKTVHSLTEATAWILSSDSASVSGTSQEAHGC